MRRRWCSIGKWHRTSRFGCAAMSTRPTAATPNINPLRPFSVYDVALDAAGSGSRWRGRQPGRRAAGHAVRLQSGVSRRRVHRDAAGEPDRRTEAGQLSARSNSPRPSGRPRASRSARGILPHDQEPPVAFRVRAVAERRLLPLDTTWTWIGKVTTSYLAPVRDSVARVLRIAQRHQGPAHLRVPEHAAVERR